MFEEDEIDDNIGVEQSINDFDEYDNVQGKTINNNTTNDLNLSDNSNGNFKQNIANQIKKNNNQNINGGLPYKKNDNKVTNKLQNIKNNIGNNIKDQNLKGNSNEKNAKNDSSKNSFSNSKDLDDNKTAVNQVAEHAVSKGASAVLQSFGVPKPIADKISEKLSGPLLKVIKFIAILPFVLFIIIFVSINNNFKDNYKSDERVDYLYGTGSEEDLITYLMDMGYCNDEETCSSSEAAQYYKTLKSALDSNSNLTKKDADVFIIELMMYERDAEDTFKAIEELNYIISLIGQSKFSLDNTESYKEAFINVGGYFDIYRQDLLTGSTDDENLKIKQSIFDEVIESAKDATERIDFNIVSLVGGTCSYNVNGSELSNVKIQLTQCIANNPNIPIEGEELVDFEKYILGVVYQENGSAPSEALKTQAIAARSYTLTRRKAQVNEDGQVIINMRNCTYDQVYCDPDKGCWSDKIGGQTRGNSVDNILATVHSGEDTSKTWHRGPIAEEAEIRKNVSEVEGVVAVSDSSAETAKTGYIDKDQKEWTRLANLGYDYNSIIKKHYGLSVISNCLIYKTGDFVNWKQSDPQWANITLGNTSTTIKQAGCLVTSVAIQLAKSGVETSIADLNPGTFVNAIKGNGGFVGDSYIWSSVTNIAPKFVIENPNETLAGTKAEKAARLQELAQQGYFVIIRAKTNQHWVALDKVEGENVYIHDPAGAYTSLWDRYAANDVNKCATYKVIQ